MKKSLLVLPICILLILFPHLRVWGADKIQGDLSPLEEFNIDKEKLKKEAEKYPGSYVKMPYAGINIILNDSKEIEVIGVVKGLPADVAGIQVDDIVIKMDGKVIKNRYQAFKIYERKSPGNSMEVEIKRNGKALRKKIQLETIDMPYDLYAMGELISKEIPVRLAVVAGDVNLHAEAEQYKKLIISRVINLFEGAFVNRYRNENNIVIIDRQLTEAILNEFKFQESGLVSNESRKKIGRLLGASHLLVINYSLITDKAGGVYALLTRKLIEIESGKILATVSGDFEIGKSNKLTTVREDLIDYYNNGIMNVFPLEVEAGNAYSNVTGDKYISDDIMLKSLVSIVIPKYETFFKQLVSISPKTTDVKNIHKLYIEGANFQFEAFKGVKLALETKDKQLFNQANKTMEKGRNKMKEFVDALEELRNREKITFK